MNRENKTFSQLAKLSIGVIRSSVKVFIRVREGDIGCHASPEMNTPLNVHPIYNVDNMYALVQFQYVILLQHH